MVPHSSMARMGLDVVLEFRANPKVGEGRSDGNSLEWKSIPVTM
jgi:hypothetical protein